MNEYDLAEAFRRIENELMASMIRNMDRHRAEETKEGYNWSMWQTEQLKALEKYKIRNQKKYSKRFKSINDQIDSLIRMSRSKGGMHQERRILQAIKKGWKVHGTNRSPAHQAMTAEFFKLNDDKLEALTKATRDDMEKAETAVLRKANDDYRKAIFNAQVYANTGAGTYEKAVDMATKDMLSRGLNCVEYANGARHTLSDYADMAIRTASKRAYLQGEGEKRKEWGIATVIMAKRGNPCPKCLPFVGKVLIDDVWSGGSKDGVDPETGKKYPLMSYAISKGLYHPRCKDSHTTYFPGISTADDTWTNEELENIGLQSRQEARQQYAQRQEEKYGRLAEYSLDLDDQQRYQQKKKEWENVVEQEIKGQIEELEKQFSDMTEGYSYDDFIKDFSSIEEGFEGAEEQEIQKAQEIADKIKALKATIKSEKITRTKAEAMRAFETLGVDFKDNSADGISGETMNKFADFITNFEQTHAGYFNKNQLQLRSISIVDKLKENGTTAAGAYYSDSQSIKLTKKTIGQKTISKLITYSKSDDYELHTFAHEYGHYIADTLEKNILITDDDVVQNSLLRYFDNDIFKTKPGNLAEALGSYGSTSAREAFAEAFAEAYTCKKPREFAKIFKEELEKVIAFTKNREEVKSVAKVMDFGIIISGARITNIFSQEADKFAEMYYKEIRSFSTDTKRIAENLGKKESDIKKIKAYLFEDNSLLDVDTGERRRFDPDCAIAQSWQRLMTGKDIKPHDKTLIEHELLEMKIKKENPNMEHWKAHELASEKYDYPKEAMEYYGNLEKHKENK